MHFIMYVELKEPPNDQQKVCFLGYKDRALYLQSGYSFRPMPTVGS